MEVEREVWAGIKKLCEFRYNRLVLEYISKETLIVRAKARVRLIGFESGFKRFCDGSLESFMDRIFVQTTTNDTGHILQNLA